MKGTFVGQIVPSPLRTANALNQDIESGRLNICKNIREEGELDICCPSKLFGSFFMEPHGDWLRATSVPRFNDGTFWRRPPSGAYEPRWTNRQTGKVEVRMTVDLFIGVLNLLVGFTCLYLALRQI